MSSMSLEERRAERRRKRQMEEETSSSGIKSADEIHADIQERLARRRRERDDRIASIASSVATVNGEDDLERRRRERREQRLRASGDTDYTSTDDYSSRRNRRRGTDDNTTEDTSSYSSYRSRRYRNWDDEETPTVNEEPASSVPDTSDEDRRRRQREEEEEEAQRQAEREAEEERQRRAALEEERRREEEAQRFAEEKRQRQEEARRLAEEERQREEEEEQRRDDEAEFKSESEGSSEEDNYKQHQTENKLFIEEDDLVAADVPEDKFERIRQWNEQSNHVDNVEKQNSDSMWIKNENAEKSKSVDRSGSFKEINNNKIRDKLDKFEHLKNESDTKTVITKSVMIPIVEKDGLKGKLQKFEKEIKEQEVSAKDPHRQPSRTVKLEVSTPQPQKLTKKVQQFESAARSQSASKPSSLNVQFELANLGSARRQRQSMLGRWSTSESHINKTDSKVPKRNVLDRWKSVDKQQQPPPTVTSPTEKKEQLNKRLSGNTEFRASKYLEKASKSVEESQIQKTPVISVQKNSFTQSFDQRNTTHSSETQSNVSEDVSSYQSRAKVTNRWPFSETQSEISEETPVKQSRAKVTNRWPYNGDNENIKSTPKLGQSVGHSRGIHSRESSSDNTYSHSRGSSIDGSSESSKRSLHHPQQEEEEEERLRQAKEGRMAAEEGQKKRTKRKGLGGLTPEKKKKLKDFIADIAYDDDEIEEKERALMERVQPLPDDLDYLSSAELKKLIKSLHDKLAQIHCEAYDIEFKLNKQEKEIVDLNMKISDSRGKFAKPVLRKVNKTEQKFAKLSKQAEHKGEFRETLQSAHDDDEGAE